jgi:hypothetical protein
MTVHLKNCLDCQTAVSQIQETAHILAKSQITITPPLEIKTNVMLTIDKNRYKENTASSHPLTKNKINSARPFELKNWGFSMVAAGILLFVLNLTLPTPKFESNQVAVLNNALGKQITLPFDKISQVTEAVLHKIDSLNIILVK